MGEKKENPVALEFFNPINTGFHIFFFFLPNFFLFSSNLIIQDHVKQNKLLIIIITMLRKKEMNLLGFSFCSVAMYVCRRYDLVLRDGQVGEHISIDGRRIRNDIGFRRSKGNSSERDLYK